MTYTISSRFDEQALEVFRLAVEIIQRYYHNQIDTEHILLALIERPNGITSKILNNLNVSVEELTERLDTVLRASPKVNVFNKNSEQVFITPRVKRIFDLADKESTRLYDERISSEHIFLSIFTEKNTPVIRILESLKITYETVNTEIVEIRRNNKNTNQGLQVFLCHSSSDKPKVRELYQRLRNDGISPWLDEEDLLPGFDWRIEIPKAVQNSDVVIVCLSKDSVTKTGYVQKEIKQALDVADEQPEGRIFIIPLKLEECDIPKRLSRWQWVNLFNDNGYQRLLRSLNIRTEEKKKSNRTQHSL